MNDLVAEGGELVGQCMESLWCDEIDRPVLQQQEVQRMRKIRVELEGGHCAMGSRVQRNSAGQQP